MARNLNGAGDVISSNVTLHPTTATYLLAFRRTGNGDSSFPRLLDQQASQLRIIYDTTGADTLSFVETFTSGESSWTWPAPALNAWSRLAIQYDGGSFNNDPSIWMDNVKQTLTPNKVGSGTFVGSSSGYLLGNRSAQDRSWQGDLAEFAAYSYLFSEDRLKAASGKYSPDFWADYHEYIPMLRDNISRRAAAPTLTGTTVVPHPPMIYPSSGRARKWVAPAGGGTPFTKAVADTVGLTEALSRRAARPIAETIALTETITRQTNRALAESIGLSESLQPQTRKLLAEAVSLTEVAAKQIGKALAEGVALSENLTTVKAVLKSVADSLTLTENLARMVGKAEADSVGLTESVARLTTRALAETVSLTEAEQRQVRRTIAESLSLAESLVTSVVKLHQEAETVALTEAVRRQTGRTVTETVVLTEAEARQIGRAIQETLGLTETRIVQVARRVTEQVSLAEVLGTLFLSGVPATFHIVRIAGETFGGPAMAAEFFGGPRMNAESFSGSR